MPGDFHGCPYCGSTSLWRSRSSKLRHLARLVGLHPIRCGGCQQRFWRFTLHPPPANPTRRVRKPSDRVAPADAKPAELE